MKDFTCLPEMYNSREYESFISDKLGNDLFINDPDRAERIHDAAEDGVDGSTHQERIDDWRDFLNTLKIIDPEDETSKGDITQQVYDSITVEIDACEEWHLKNGSLEQAGC
jgi:hypothetical protein